MEHVLQVPVGTLAAREEATIAFAQVAGQLEKNYVDVGIMSPGRRSRLIDITSYSASPTPAPPISRAPMPAPPLMPRKISNASSLQKERSLPPAISMPPWLTPRARDAEVKAAEANDAVVRRSTLGRSRVKAPSMGPSRNDSASAGDYLAVGTPMARLVQTDPLRLRFEVPERDRSSCKPVKSCAFLPRATPIFIAANWRASRRRFGRTIGCCWSRRMCQTRVDCGRDCSHGRRSSSMNGRSAERAANRADHFCRIGKVVVVKEGKVAEKTVTTGRREKNWVEITSGLNAGETVVLDPAGLPPVRQ